MSYYGTRQLYRMHDLTQTYYERMEYSADRWFSFVRDNKLAAALFLSDTLDLTIYKNRHMPGAPQPCVSGMAWLLQHYYSIVNTYNTHAEYTRCPVNLGLATAMLAILNRNCRMYSMAPRIIQKTMRYMRCMDRVIATPYLPAMPHNDRFVFNQIGYNVGAMWKCFSLEQGSRLSVGYSIPLENYILDNV